MTGGATGAAPGPVSGVPFDVADDRLARVAWSVLAEPGDRDAQAFVAEHGPGGALRRVLAGAGAGRWRVRLPGLDPRRDVAAVERIGGRVLVPADDEWPAGLAALGAQAPYCLWVRGPAQLADAVLHAAAVVGSRDCTPYGDRTAAELAGGCAERGITVVSGGAYGIDGAAHRAALVSGGTTVAVLACGVDRPYPRGHDRLLERIAAEGAVVSEVPPGWPPTRWRFVERNRLIAALSRVTVVVEAAYTSGAIGTALRASRIGVPVAAVPGPVTSPTSAGCHRLMREVQAVCVTTAEEVAELAGPIGSHLPEPAPPAPGPLAGLDDRQRRVVDALPLRSAATARSVGRAAGLEDHDVSAALGRLEALGLAARDGSRWRRAGTGPPARRGTVGRFPAGGPPTGGP